MNTSVKTDSRKFGLNAMRKPKKDREEHLELDFS